MFHFPTFPPHALCVQARVTPHDWCGVPPFGHPRINARLAAPRGLTQPPTSFIGSWCPGIHRVPLTTWPHKNPPTPGHPRTDGRTRAGTYLQLSLQSQKMLASTVQFSTTGRPPPRTAPPDPHPTGCGGTGTGMAPNRDNSPRPVTRAGPAPSGPNSVPTTRPPRRPRSTRPRGAVLGAGEHRRPNWSAFHPRAPPRTPAGRSKLNGRSRCGRGCRGPPGQPPAAGRSLERR
jgi:hypothetical protein